MAGVDGDKDVALLERVLLKIAMCDTDEKSEAQLKGLLAPILAKAATPSPAARAKLMEILSHINKILKSRPTIKLPVDALLAQLQDPAVPAGVKPFTMIYLRMGCERLPPAGIQAVAHRLLQAAAGRPAAQQTTLMNLAMPYCGQLALPADREEALVFLGCDNKGVRTALLTLIRDVFLLANTSVQPGMQAAPDAPATLPPGGLSRTALQRIFKAGGCQAYATRESLAAVKLGLVEFLRKSPFADDEVFTALIAAAGDTGDKVAERADTEIRRRDCDLEAPETLRPLFALFLGTVQDPKRPIAPDERRQPGTPRHQALILTLLRRSRKACDSMPSTLQVIFNALYGRDVTERVRVLGMQFMHRVFELAPLPTLGAIAGLMLKQLLKLVDERPGPQLEGLAYTAVGKLAHRCPAAIQGDIGLLQRFFEAAADAESASRLYVRDALNMMRSAYASTGEAQRPKLIALLNTYVSSTDDHARLLAVQYANTVFAPAHMPSRFLCLLASGDPNTDVREEAFRGLSRFRSADALTNPDGAASRGDGRQLEVSSVEELQAQYVPFREAVAFAVAKVTTAHAAKRKAGDAERPGARRVPFEPLVYSNLLAYLRRCLGATTGAWEDQDTYLLQTGTAGGRLRLLMAYLDAPAQREAGVVQEYFDLLLNGLAPYASPALHVQALSGLLELAAAAPPLAPTMLEHLGALKPFVSSSVAPTREAACRLIGHLSYHLEAAGHDALVGFLLDTLARSRGKPSGHDAHAGSMLALGFVLGAAEGRGRDAGLVRRALQSLVSALGDEDEALRITACAALGEAGRCGPLPLPDGAVLPASAAVDPEPKRAKGEEGATAASAEDGAMSKQGVVSKLVDLTRQKQKNGKTTVIEAAALALGLLCVGDFPHPHTAAIEEALCQTARLKSPELNFSVGEALSCAGAGPWSTAGLDPWDVRSRTADPATADEQCVARMEEVMVALENKWLNNNLAVVRRSAGVWLLCIVKYCGKHPALMGRLTAVQGVFARLLSEGDDFTQDIASKGLGLVYDLGDAALKKTLVTMLVGQLTSGKRAATQKFEQGSEDRVFEEGALGEQKGGGGLSTYKELCSLASDLNQPELVYQFMHLANHNMQWNSRKGAAFGFGKIAALAGKELEQHLPTLIPRLYRYQYDPSPAIRDSMKNIWRVLVAEPVAAVDKYCPQILAELLKTMTDKQWRTRESSALALADLLRGRTWKEVGDSMVDMWRICWRVVDDVKESVRKAGDAACKRMMKLTVRLCSTEAAGEQASQRALKTLLPIMMTEGLVSSVNDVRAMSLNVMIDMAKEAGDSIKPHITTLIMTLLEAMSGLESPYLDYLGQRLSRRQGMEEQLDDMRMAASKTSPLTSCMERCVAFVDAEILVELVPQLLSMMKKGLGASTKAGCAHLVSRLVQQCRNDLQPYSKKLLRALLSAAMHKSAPVRRDFASAAGNLVKVATPAAIEALLTKARKMYLDHESVEAIEASGVVCMSISRNAPDVLRAYAADILPLSFLGMHDESRVVADVWSSVWSDHAAGMEGGVRLYLAEILEISLPLLESRSWSVKKQAATTLGAVAKHGRADHLLKHRESLEAALLAACKGRVWDGKTAVVVALAALCKGAKEYYVGHPESLKVVVKALLAECRKKNKEYRLSVLPPVADLLKALDGVGDVLFDDIAQVALTLLTRPTDEEGSEDEESERREGMAARASQKEVTEVAALGMLQGSWPSKRAGLEAAVAQLWATIVAHLRSGTWKVRGAASHATAALLERLAAVEDVSAAAPLTAEMADEAAGGLVKDAQDKSQSKIRIVAVKGLIGLAAYLRAAGTPLSSLSHGPAIRQALPGLEKDPSAEVRSYAAKLAAALQ